MKSAHMKSDEWIKLILVFMDVKGPERCDHISKQLKQCWDYATVIEASYSTPRELSANVAGGIGGAFVAGGILPALSTSVGLPLPDAAIRYILTPALTVGGPSFLSYRVRKSEGQYYDAINNDDKRVASFMEKGRSSNSLSLSFYNGSVAYKSIFLRQLATDIRDASSLAEKSKILDAYCKFTRNNELKRAAIGGALSTTAAVALTLTKLSTSAVAISAGTATAVTHLVSTKIFDFTTSKVPTIPKNLMTHGTVAEVANEKAVAPQATVGLRQRK